MSGEQYSLRVLLAGRPVFTSRGKWLHPLFELEAFLADRKLDPAGLSLEDKVVGRGAAYLIVRLGIRRVHAGLLSRRGREVFERHGIGFTCDREVEKIDCATEDLLAEVSEVEAAFALLAERARANRTLPRPGFLL